MPRWPSQPAKRTEPYSEDEILNMRKSGDTVSTILKRAEKVNGWKRAKVREILFGKAY
jgi:hypothetical protein